jgi:purine-binding chemotaxis protein CheW
MTDRHRTNGTAGDVEPAEAQRDAIFARRAEALAATPPADTSVDAFEALVFALGRERYAFPRTQVREVRPPGELTALPGAPAFIAGLVNVRGRIVAVLDLRVLFGARPDSAVVQSLVLVAHPRGDVAILATGRPSVQMLLTAGMGQLPAGVPAGLDPAYVRGVTPDLVIVLDAEHLLADSRLVVQEDGPSRP